MAGLTRSQSLFSVYVGLDARALEINGSDEFFLFMDLHAERRWVSYNMNSRKWLSATNEFNSRLDALNAAKNAEYIPKHLRHSWNSSAMWKQRSRHGLPATILHVRTFAVLRLIVQLFQTSLTHLDSGQRRQAPTRSGGDIDLPSRS